jgi:hypothetical protein
MELLSVAGAATGEIQALAAMKNARDFARASISGGGCPAGAIPLPPNP